MMWDDIVYVVLLLSCVGFGHYFRQLKGIQLKQWVATTLGVILAFMVSGNHIVHPLIFTFVNAFLITKLSWRVCHLASVFFSFSYLLFFFRLLDWYGLPNPPGHTNLIQMILTLKLSGMAFERHIAHTTPEDDERGDNREALKNIGFMEVVHYGFNYSGVLSGPYYRYRTYWDWLHRPFSEKIDHWEVARAKLAEASVYCVLYLISEHYFPVKYATTEEFAGRSLAYRLFFIYPTFFSFRMRLYTGMMISSCVCYMSGLGAYPTSSTPVSGMGPRNYKAMEELLKNPEAIKKEDLDFETVHNVYPWILEVCHSTRVQMKMWNSCIQYWLGTYVYRRFPVKQLRMIVTLALSSAWHGYSAGYYLCICQVVLYLPSEDIFVKYYNQLEEGSPDKRKWKIMLWVAKVTCLSYLALTFQLLDIWDCLDYYKNVYFVGQVLALVSYIIAIVFVRDHLKERNKDGTLVEKKKE